MFACPCPEDLKASATSGDFSRMLIGLPPGGLYESYILRDYSALTGSTAKWADEEQDDAHVFAPEVAAAAAAAAAAAKLTLGKEGASAAEEDLKAGAEDVNAAVEEPADEAGDKKPSSAPRKAAAMPEPVKTATA
jgi:hypothetical protein